MKQSPRIRLRPWDRSDLPFLLELRNDLRLQSLLLSRTMGSTELDVRAWAESKSKGHGHRLLIAEAASDRMRIGYLQISPDPSGTDAYHFGICLADEFQGQGLGELIINDLEQILGSELSARKVVLTVDAANSRALRLYEKLGYRTVGTLLRHVLVQGTSRDVVIVEKSL